MAASASATRRSVSVTPRPAPRSSGWRSVSTKAPLPSVSACANGAERMRLLWRTLARQAMLASPPVGVRTRTPLSAALPFSSRRVWPPSAAVRRSSTVRWRSRPSRRRLA